MIDIETMGRESGAAILSIGAVIFDITGPLHRFYTVIDLQDSQRQGFSMCPETLVWWMGQSSDARAVFSDNGVTVESALVQLREFLPVGDFEIWCQGASFDFPILAHAYRRLGMRTPWHYWRERCLRTVIYTQNYDEGTFRLYAAHQALCDAEQQVTRLLEIESRGKYA